MYHYHDFFISNGIRRFRQCKYSITGALMLLPVGLLAFNRTVVCFATSGAREHLAALYSPAGAGSVEAQSHLWYVLDLFVLLIQAGSRNTLPVILN